MFDYDDYFYDVLKFKTMTNLEKEKLKNDFVISKCHNLFEYIATYYYDSAILTCNNLL